MMKICIYIPVTRADFLDQTFSSVTRQTCQDFQVLVMDNTIDAHQIVEDKFDEFFGQNGNAQLIKTPHHLGDGDPTESWNYGLAQIETTYFTLLGDDDALSIDYVEKMLVLMSENKDAPIYRCQVHMINEKDQITKYGQSIPKTIAWDKYIYDRKTYKFIQSTSEFCIRTESLNKIGGYLSYPYAICSDDATYVTLMLSGDMISTNNTYVYWRRHGNNLSMKVPYKTKICASQKFYDYITDLLENHSHTLLDESLLRVVKVNRIQEMRNILKSTMYRLRIIRPLIKYLHNEGLIKTI